MMCVLCMSETVVIANRLNHMADKFGHLHDFFFGANPQIMNDCQMLMADSWLHGLSPALPSMIGTESSHNGKRVLQSSLVSVQQYLIP